jgi:hypothetical protein
MWRLRLFGLVGALALAGLLAAPVAAAGPVNQGWDMVGGRAPDQCTGEYFDNSGKVHFVEEDSGLFHFNVHVEGLGETSGLRYVYDVQDNENLHAAPDGTYIYDRVLNFGLVSQGSSPNQRLTIRIRQVFDSQGNLISDSENVSFDCQGS